MEQIMNTETNTKNLNKQKGKKKGRPPQSQLLLELCKELELFCNLEGEAYTSLQVEKHFETHSILRSGFGNWLRNQYFLKFESAPSSQAFQEALSTLVARAHFQESKHDVFLRVAGLDQKVFIDLGDPEWRVIEVSCTGWKVLTSSPVKFRRTRRMLPLPLPQSPSTASIENLRSYLNIKTEADLQLIIAFILSAFNPSGPYPVLVLYGEQGCAKSTTVKVIRSLIDPNETPLRSAPRSTDDLLVSARNSWIAAFDNVSHLHDWLSDDICRLSTGGGLSKRELYSNDEELVLNAKRPVILNGISEFVTRGDLASRSIPLYLPLIQGDARKREEDLWNSFEIAKPQILGCILDGVSCALRCRGSIELPTNVRMADAFHWATAAESSFGWAPGSILAAFHSNQTAANETVLQSSPIYPYIRLLSEVGWSGTPYANN